MRSLVRRAFVSFALLAAVGAMAIAAAPVAVGDPPGAFVIGDGNTAVGPHATFWGAQWWKDNELSAGTAPPAFKGFAVNVDPVNCLFTTTTGNSASPPSGPLPPFVTVLVTSSVVQSGSTITGKVIGSIVVRTDDGYMPDPGHAGTGTVEEDSFVPCAAL